MENIEKTLVFENVQNLIFTKVFKINALQDKIDFSTRSKDGYILRNLNGQMKLLMNEFKGLCEMACVCGYDVVWHYKNGKIVVESINTVSVHEMLAIHHYYDKEVEGLV